MAEIPFHNPHLYPIPVGGRSVLPGETRMIAESALPPHLIPARAAPPPEPEKDPIADLLGDRADDIRRVLPDLTESDLERLRLAEEARKGPRVTLLRAIAEEQLRRASQTSENPLGPSSEDRQPPGAGGPDPGPD